jgi:hypothetical protein
MASSTAGLHDDITGLQRQLREYDLYSRQGVGIAGTMEHVECICVKLNEQTDQLATLEQRLNEFNTVSPTEVLVVGDAVDLVG